MKIVHVAVGVIARGNDIFITLRQDHLHQGGNGNFLAEKLSKVKAFKMRSLVNC